MIKIHNTHSIKSLVNNKQGFFHTRKEKAVEQEAKEILFEKLKEMAKIELDDF